MLEYKHLVFDELFDLQSRTALESGVCLAVAVWIPNINSQAPVVEDFRRCFSVCITACVQTLGD